MPMELALPALALTGRRIVVPETREIEVLAGMLERHGATVVRCPLVAIRDAEDPAPITAWLERFVAMPPDDLILFTGEGLQRLNKVAGAIGLADKFVTTLAQVRKITRGPKPARALRELGLASDLAAPIPTTAGVIAALEPLELAGRRVAVQLYGEESNAPLADFLRTAGASVVPIAPYRYADGADDAAIQALLTRLRAGSVDAIAFTSKAQVERLFRAAPREEVVAALAATQVAAVGPVVAESLAALGVPVQTMPHSSWFLKPLTSALSEALAR
jgi:uroporphyrinogen-III synthase